jgi:hypothetical protein
MSEKAVTTLTPSEDMAELLANSRTRNLEVERRLGRPAAAKNDDRRAIALTLMAQELARITRGKPVEESAEADANGWPGSARAASPR